MTTVANFEDFGITKRPVKAAKIEKSTQMRELWMIQASKSSNLAVNPLWWVVCGAMKRGFPQN